MKFDKYMVKFEDLKLHIAILKDTKLTIGLLSVVDALKQFIISIMNLIAQLVIKLIFKIKSFTEKYPWIIIFLMAMGWIISSALYQSKIRISEMETSKMLYEMNDSINKEKLKSYSEGYLQRVREAEREESIREITSYKTRRVSKPKRIDSTDYHSSITGR